MNISLKSWKSKNCKERSYDSLTQKELIQRKKNIKQTTLYITLMFIALATVQIYIEQYYMFGVHLTLVAVYIEMNKRIKQIDSLLHS